MAAAARRRPAASARPPQIRSIQSHTESINAMVYGDPGVGKTVLAGSDNTLIIATEDGTVSAARQGSKADVWPIKKWDDLAEVHDWADSNPNHGYDWFAVDSITEMQALCMRSILDAAVAENKSRDPDIPALQDWQKYYNMFLRFVAEFNALPVNMLYTATVMRREDEDGDDIILPNIPGKDYAISANVCAKMAVVGYMSKQRAGKTEGAKVTRSIQFDSIPPHFGKDRYDVLSAKRFVITTEEGGVVKKFNDLSTLRKKIDASGGLKAEGSTTSTTSGTTTKPRPARKIVKRTPAT